LGVAAGGEGGLFCCLGCCWYLEMMNVWTTWQAEIIMSSLYNTSLSTSKSFPSRFACRSGFDGRSLLPFRTTTSFSAAHRSTLVEGHGLPTPTRSPSNPPGTHRCRFRECLEVSLKKFAVPTVPACPLINSISFKHGSIHWYV
jgi:hypothetical protein